MSRLIDAEQAKAMYPDCRGFAEKIDRVPTAEQEMQKPLTLEEVDARDNEPCDYIEFKGREGIEAGLVYKAIAAPGTLNQVIVVIKTVGTEYEIYKHPEEYGKNFRCWATNPSDAERKAAAWEE